MPELTESPPAAPSGPTVRAEFAERKRIVFTARERAFVNVREAAADGLIGFSSTELLLIAVGNCSLGWLFNHPLLKEEDVFNIRADLRATMASEPSRVVRIETAVTGEVANPELLKHIAELEAIACTCPMCNSISAEKVVSVRFEPRRA